MLRRSESKLHLLRLGVSSRQSSLERFARFLNVVMVTVQLWIGMVFGYMVFSKAELKELNNNSRITPIILSLATIETPVIPALPN